jgi:hypothetical protein
MVAQESTGATWKGMFVGPCTGVKRRFSIATTLIRPDVPKFKPGRALACGWGGLRTASTPTQQFARIGFWCEYILD